MKGLFVGVDVGASAFHCVGLGERGAVEETAVIPVSEVTQLADWASEARATAIDAPAQLSTAPHRDDPRLSPKFAVARCAEIELGRGYGHWVPWVAPTREPLGWMAAGLDLFRELRRRGAEAIEVYPYAGYRELVRPARLPRKTTAAGVRARAEALHGAGIQQDNLLRWSHDSLDALVAALIARDYAAGSAVAATCGHDGSAIWLPAARGVHV